MAKIILIMIAIYDLSDNDSNNNDGMRVSTTTLIETSNSNTIYLHQLHISKVTYTSTSSHLRYFLDSGFVLGPCSLSCLPLCLCLRPRHHLLWKLYDGRENIMNIKGMH